MGQAEDLLNGLSGDSGSTYIIDPTIEEHIVIGQDRFITIPEELKRIAVQYDHDIETVIFDCPRYWDEHDMSTMNIYINYVRADGMPGVYRAGNITVDAEDPSVMHFEWTISRNVTMVQGNVKFIVCVKNVDNDGIEKNHWNSEICRDMYVSEGLEHDDVIALHYADVISQIIAQIDSMGGNIGGGTGGAGSNITVDSYLSTSSTNPVQNRIITSAIRNIETSIGNIDSLLQTI